MAHDTTRRGLPIAVIDNTLLTRIVFLEVAQFLPLIYKQILIPVEVKKEAYRAPHKGKRRLRKLIKEMTGFFVDCTDGDDVIKQILQADLDAGEAAAIAQADYTKAHVLIDEKKGFNRAKRMDLKAIRTTSVLLMLRQSEAIPKIRPYFDKLTQTGFYLDPELRQRLLAEVGEE